MEPETPADDRDRPDPGLVAPTEEERSVYASSVFDAQTIDRAWAVDAERTLSTKLKGASDARVSIGSVDCRSTLCRFEVKGEDQGAVNEFMRKAIRSEIGAGMAVRGEEGTEAEVSLTVYIAREGSPVPEPLAEHD